MTKSFEINGHEATQVEYGVNINNGTDGWDDNDMADWYSTFEKAYEAAQEAIKENDVTEVTITEVVDGEVSGSHRELRKEDGDIREYQGGERLWL